MSLVVPLGLIVVLGVVSQWLAWRLRMPAILFLLAAGFLVGPVTGLLDIDALLGDLLEPVVGLSVGVILFEGGLGLRFREIRAHGPVVARLVTLGVLVTGVVGAVAAHALLGLPWDLAALLGAILTVTGPTVVLPLLRHVRPERHTEAVLRWEGILVDPVGAVLAVLVFEVIQASGAEGVGVFVQTLAGSVLAGAAIGIAIGYALMVLEARYWIPDHLGAAMGLAAVLGAYVGADAIQEESGLVAATVMGIFLANQKRASIRHLLDFKEDLSQILLGSLFIVLAARLPADAFSALPAGAWWFLGALVLVARPLCVLVSTWGSPLPWRGRAFLAWMAPRGIVAAAVSAFFALRLQDAGRAEAAIFVPITFLIIVGTVALYGLTARPAARLLRVAGPRPQGVLIIGANAIGRALARILEDADITYLLVDTNPDAVTAARVDGRRAQVANALGRHFIEETDLTGIGTLWAITANPETNALAAMRMADEFGRARVYQMPVKLEQEDGVEKHLRGRYLFSGLTYAELRDRVKGGWEVRRTPITSEFGHEDYRRQHGEDAVPLFLVTAGGRIEVFTDEYEPEVEPGKSLVGLVPRDAEPRTRRVASPGADEES